MSTYMNRCQTCGCTDETRIMRREYDEMKEMCHRLLVFINNVHIVSILDNCARNCINADCEQMGLHIPRRSKNED